MNIFEFLLPFAESLLPLIGQFLKTVIKDPAKYAHLKGVLTEIAADIATALAGM